MQATFVELILCHIIVVNSKILFSCCPGQRSQPGQQIQEQREQGSESAHAAEDEHCSTRGRHLLRVHGTQGLEDRRATERVEEKLLPKA